MQKVGIVFGPIEGCTQGLLEDVFRRLTYRYVEIYLQISKYCCVNFLIYFQEVECMPLFHCMQFFTAIFIGKCGCLCRFSVKEPPLANRCFSD